MSDLAKRLRAGEPSECEFCKADSVVLVRCGRGECAAVSAMVAEAADRIEALEAVVRECGAQFRYYEANHRAKRDLAKAEINAEFARKSEALLP